MTQSPRNPGEASRVAALRLLDAVLRRGQTLEAALGPATRGLDLPADRAQALAIASETLRWLPDLDALIDSATRQALPEDAKARGVLRLALVQALRMGTPPHAVIATALPLVGGGPRRLVHGVLGTLLRRAAGLPEIPALPADVAARWNAETRDGAARALAEAPPLDLTLRDPADNGGVGGEALAPWSRRLPRGHDVTTLPGFDTGKWWVQNLSASIPARLLGPGDGRVALDLCAAPGGKTLQLASAGWRVTALDSSGTRLERLRANCARTALAAEIVQADVMDWSPPAPVDAILLDAPCTSTGTLARHPDVLHRIGAKDIAALARVQAAMLARAASWLKPNGRLVYATCSLEHEEGEDIARGCALVLDPIRADELPAGLTPAAQGWLRIAPEPGRDGFFIARFRGKGKS